ncbi:beta-defensin 108B [Panthera tigris]|uniref:beta-defensin 108B n=1 Tax=Panthera tigris TaxID=9694 RepID=UPI001C6F6F96|nr:beta-defensin 108B [Panthera tigris]
MSKEKDEGKDIWTLARGRVPSGGDGLGDTRDYEGRYLPGKFKEICERPNGSCQEFCLEKEVHARQCLNGLTCCLPVGNEPFIKPTTPKER